MWFVLFYRTTEPPAMATHTVRWRLDLLAGSLYAVLAPIVTLAVGVPSNVRAVLALPLVLFVPGYALLAAVYPERWSDDETTNRSSSPLVGDATHSGIAPGERIILSVVASAAVVALLALAVNFSPFRIRPAPVSIAVSAFTVACFAVALVRRASLAAERRSGLPLGGVLDSLRGQFTVHSPALLSGSDARPTSRRTVAFNLLVAVAVLAVVAGAAFAYTAPTADQDFTEFYLVGENETGAYTVNAVPSSLDAGEQQTLYPTVTNQDDTAHEYSVVVELQRAEQTDDGVDVRASRTLDTLNAAADSGETERVSHQVGPLEPGGSYRVVYLLYTGDPPSDPSTENAHRSVTLWFDVTDDGGGN